MSKSLWSLTSNALKYSQARPSHPKKIAKNAIAYLKEDFDGALYQAADVGSGTGISTGNLYGEFQSVVGIEASQAMVEQARESVVHGSVKFLCARAENLPLEANSTQLVLVGRAIHYFDAEKFYKEVDRILVSKGVLCYYSVDFPTVSSSSNSVFGSAVNKVFWNCLNEKLTGYWPVNPTSGFVYDVRRREYYLNHLQPPYTQFCVDETVSQDRESSVLQLARELDTYSGSVGYRERNGDSEADTFIGGFVEECRQIGEDLKVEGDCLEYKLTATDNFFMVMSRKP